MASLTITANGSKGHHKFTLVVEETTVGSSSQNTSEVTYTFQIAPKVKGYDWSGWSNKISYTVTIDGTEYTGTIPSYNGSSTVTLKTGTQTIQHNDDGNKSIAISFSVSDTTGQSYTCGNASSNGTLALTYIPRYATSNQSLSSRTETSLTISWSSDNTCDYIWYSTNNGTNWISVGSVNASSGSYTISGLTANNSYTVKTRVRRKDSQLTTDSSSASWSTYPYPYISAVGTTNLTIGNAQTLTLYNPLTRIVTVYMKYNNTSGTQIYSGNTTAQNPTSITFTPNASTMYGLIPNSKSGNCVYYLVYNDGTTNHTSATKSGTFVVNEENNKPTVTTYTPYDNNSTTYALTNNRAKIVLNASNMQLTIVANAKNSATFNNNGYIKVNGTALTLTISGSNATGVYTLNKPSSATYTIALQDSRGITSNSISYTLPNYANYFVPTIITNAVRNQPTNNIIDISGSGSFFNASFGATSNKLTATYTVKNATTSVVLETGSMTVTKSGNTHTESQKQVSNADYTQQYLVTIAVTDKLNTVQSNVTVPQGIPVFNWDNNEFDVNVQLNANGLLQYGSSGRQDYSANGFSYDQWGNMKHLSSTSTNTWKMQSYDGTNKITIYPETGNTVVQGTGQVNGDFTCSSKIIIGRSSSKGLWNSDGKPIIRDHGNTNVTVDATGSTLFLGYQNTTGINILNGKASVDSNGNILTNTYLKVINGSYSSDPTSSFQTTLFGTNNNGYRIKAIRGETGYTNFSAYSSGLAWTTGDTHSYIMPNYRTAQCYIGGGNGDALNWVKEVAWKDNLTTNILSARPSADVTISASGPNKLTLNTQIFKNGSALSIANGGIKIGAGITKVFVSGSIYFSASTNAGDSLRILIYKNSSIVASNYERAGTNGTYEHRVIVPYPITVAEGDYIYLYYNNASAGRGKISSSTSDTYLIVTEIK